jgi:hypothetical protein
MKLVKLVLVAVLVLAGAACGSDDDGSDVRNIGEESSESGSGSGSGSGSHASGSESASGSASAPADGCHVEDGIEATDAAEVHAALGDFSIEVDTDSVTADAVTFEAENVGEHDHELAVVRADDAESLPTDDDGAVDLEALGDDVIGEIEAFPAGETCEGTFELEAGDYVLLCNLVEHGGEEVHFELGMHTTFSVTG